MRNLTITRTKSFVASLAKMKVYIEDADANELTIHGVPCRKLGDLKNGETVTFPISQREAKVFVIADKTSRNYANDYYPIPAGSEDVTLTGKNAYNPGAGNPFRFDGVTDETVLANRKKGSKKGWVIIAVAAIAGFLFGWFNPFTTQAVQDKEFTVQDMSIMLNDSFQAVDYEGYTRCFESKTAIVLTLEESFTLAEGLEDYTLEEYGQLVLQSNGQDVQLQTRNGITYFDYTWADAEGNEYYYFVTLHKEDDAFWLIQFSTMASNREKLQDTFLEWARSVTFDGF